jgi:hypothetical protein
VKTSPARHLSCLWASVQDAVVAELSSTSIFPPLDQIQNFLELRIEGSEVVERDDLIPPHAGQILRISWFPRCQSTPLQRQPEGHEPETRKSLKKHFTSPFPAETESVGSPGRVHPNGPAGRAEQPKFETDFGLKLAEIRRILTVLGNDTAKVQTHTHTHTANTHSKVWHTHKKR